jgi:predicted RNase H-like HicB family nuclease/uncharacterized damage-inducible protein DinB
VWFKLPWMTMMKAYDLYLESGPRRRKTMVHVLDLLGCVAVGPTTEAALDETPEAITGFLTFMQEHGDAVDPEEAFDVKVVEHITEGTWLGNGSPYVMYGPDFEPVTQAALELYLRRFGWIRSALADWAKEQTQASLDAQPEQGRTARAILLHVLGATGGYLAAGLGGAPGFSRLHGQAERGEVPLPNALWECLSMAVTRARESTETQRRQVIQKRQGPRTFHQTLRRMLEHDWEHLAELSRRSGGPTW